MTPKLAAIIADVSEEQSSGAPAVPDGHPLEPQDLSPLSEREKGVLRFVIQGLTNKEVAARMDLSESVVKNTMQQLFNKAGVRTRSQLVRVAIEWHRNLL